MWPKMIWSNIIWQRLFDQRWFCKDSIWTLPRCLLGGFRFTGAPSILVSQGSFPHFDQWCLFLFFEEEKNVQWWHQFWSVLASNLISIFKVFGFLASNEKTTGKLQSFVDHYDYHSNHYDDHNHNYRHDHDVTIIIITIMMIIND